MRQIQIWLPLLNNSWDIPSFKRDIERAQKNWCGEDRIWFLPGFKEIKRWQNEKTTLFECAIPSETFNLITVVNVSKDGKMHPSKGDSIPENWNGNLPQNLFELWINTGNPRLISTNNTFRITTPAYIRNELFYVEREVKLPPGPSVPFSIIDEKKREVSLSWPPEGRIVESISPEAESKELFGEYKWEDKSTPENLNTVVNNNGRRAIHTAILWNEPFNEMFPLGGGIDLLYHWSYLKKSIKELETNRGNISAQVNRFSSEGWTDLESQMVIPAARTDDMQALLFDIEGKFDISANNLEELANHPKYDDVFHDRIPVTRLFGWEGYFWWELNNIVNVKRKSIKTCELCGNIIHGKRDKTFCSKKDNPSCYRNRKKLNKRKERNG